MLPNIDKRVKTRSGGRRKAHKRGGGMDLIMAIRNKMPMEEIEALVQDDEDVNEEYEGENALNTALSLDIDTSDDIRYVRNVVILLLMYNADIMTVKDMDRLALIADEDLVNIIVEAGLPVDYSSEDGTTILMNMLIQLNSRLHNFSIVRNNLNYANQQEVMDEIRETELAIDRIVQNGAEVNIQDNQGLSVVHYMVRGPMNVYLLQLLQRVVSPENVNKVTNQNRTPLITYVMARSPALVTEVAPANVIDVLITAGADIMVRDSNGRTALDYAMARGDNEVVAILRQKEREQKESLQRALVAKGRKGFQHRIPPSIAKRITNFLGGSTRKVRRVRKAKKAHTRRRK